MYLAQRKQSKSMCRHTRIYGRRRPSPYGRLCRSSKPQRYGTGTRIALPYEPYHTVTVRSPIQIYSWHWGYASSTSSRTRTSSRRVQDRRSWSLSGCCGEFERASGYGGYDTETEVSCFSLLTVCGWLLALIGWYMGRLGFTKLTIQHG